MIAYLSSPYTHPSFDVRQQRYEATLRALVGLIAIGKAVISPVTQCHEATVRFNLPYEEKHWRFYYETLLKASDEMIVLCLPGWDESVGIARELEIASARGMAVKYITLDESIKVETV